MKRIYIAGPMSGLPDFNYPAFNEAAAELRALGYHVENPAENDLPKNSKWETYMRKAMAQLITCDTVAMLPGWGASHGANIEREFALGVGIKVVAIEKLLPHRAAGRATHLDGKFALHQGSNIDVLRTMADNSIDSIVCDPPYELGFMGKGWDSSGIAYNIELWQEAMRVLKPGGHLLAFSGSRTYHRMTVAIEDAGFDIRDQIMWLYGSGFPKSRDVSDAMDKFLAGEPPPPGTAGYIPPGVYEVTKFLREARDKAGWSNRKIDDLFGTNGMAGHWTSQASQPAVPSVRQWGILKEQLGFGDELDELVEQLCANERPEGYGEGERGGSFLGTLHKNGREFDAHGGWGTALKPAHEPVCVARKPVIGSITGNVLVHGTGGLNIGACRIGEAGGTRDVPNGQGSKSNDVFGVYAACDTSQVEGMGRWPANVIHDGSREVWSRFPIDGNASASRFFYGAKASQEDRHEGLDGFASATAGQITGGRAEGSAGLNNPAAGAGRTAGGKNFHPTVKPTDLMRYLCRLVTPPGGIVMDIFMGSGSTGKAAILEGFRFIGIDLMADHVEIAQARIAFAEVMRGDAPKPANDNAAHPDLFAAAGL